MGKQEKEFNTCNKYYFKFFNICFFIIQEKRRVQKTPA